MIRLLFWFVFILLAATGAVWLANNPGQVTLEFQSYAVDTSFAALTLLAVILAATAGATVWLIGWLRRDMPIWGKNSIIKRQARGIKMLNQSLVALSAGDHKLATQLVKEAEVLLPPQPMVHMIAAEAALRAGDHAAATKRYNALEATDEGRLLGLRGLLGEARRTGSENEALRLARLAFEENRKSPWVLQTLFALEVAAGNWGEAEAALAKVAKEKLLEPEQVKRHRGALAYAEATELSLKGDKDAARKALKKALSERPNFVPAVAALARLELSTGQIKRAQKHIVSAWANTPHPGLASVYKELDASESSNAWLKRVQALIQSAPDHPESKLLLVDATMDAKHYDVAKPVLDQLLKDKPTRKAWQYRLALAHALGEDPDPIETALEHASEGARWHCHHCGHQPSGWSPLCSNCDTFDSLDWVDEGTVKTVKKLIPDGTIALLTDPQNH